MVLRQILFAASLCAVIAGSSNPSQTLASDTTAINAKLEAYKEFDYAPEGDELLNKIINECIRTNYTKGLAEAYMHKGYFNYVQSLPDSSAFYYHLAKKHFDELGMFTRSIHARRYLASQFRDLYTNEKDSAIYYLQEALDINEKAYNFSLAATIFVDLGKVYYYSNDYKSALTYASKAKETDPDNREVYGVLGQSHYKLGHPEKALEAFLEGLVREKEAQDDYGVSIFNSYLGTLYLNMDDPEKALPYRLQSAAYDSIRFPNSINYVYDLMNLGVTYTKLEQYDQARIHYTRAIEKALSLDYELALSILYYNLGDLYFQENNQDAADSLYRESYKYCLAANDLEIASAALIGLAEIAQSNFDFEQAESLYLEAEGILNQTHIVREQRDLSEKLSQLYEQMGLHRKALQYYKTYNAYSDTLLNEENIAKMARLEADFEFQEQKDSLAYANEQEKLLMGQQILRQRTTQYATLAGVLALLIIIYILYRYYRSKQKANKLLIAKQDEIEHKNQELKELDQFKSRFFTNISHELRTPLTLIGSPLENLLQQEQNTFSPETVHTLQLMQRSTSKLKGLVNDILDLSKLESGKLELQEEPVEIKTFISRIASNYTSMAEQLEIDFVQSTSQYPSGWVLLDGKRFEKVLNNLLFNAIKYTPTGGKIELVARQEGEHLEILVSDTGQGIAEVDLPHIFERYFQSKQPDAPIQGGTGIGLAIAHELAILMGGDLTVESELGNGTTFTLCTPYKPTEKPTEEHAELSVEEEQLEDHAEEEALATAKADDIAYHVLVVEDNLDMQKYVQQLLSKEYNVSLALNGKKALEAFEMESFDLVITDAMMPEMDGYTLLQKLKDADQYRNIPVIMLTALNFEDTKLKALSIGVDDYLTKPFSPKELMVRAKNLIARYDTRKEWAIKEQEEAPAGADAPKVENQPSKVIYKADLEWLKEVEAIIRRELENNAFQITELADHLNLSRRQFQRKINKLTGLSPKQYQQEIALQKGRELLEDNTYTNVSAISFSVGISNPSRFSDMYEKRFGKRPSAYFHEQVAVEEDTD